MPQVPLSITHMGDRIWPVYDVACLVQPEATGRTHNQYTWSSAKTEHCCMVRVDDGQ